LVAVLLGFTLVTSVGIAVFATWVVARAGWVSKVGVAASLLGLGLFMAGCGFAYATGSPREQPVPMSDLGVAAMQEGGYLAILTAVLVTLRLAQREL
jgi:hypothetical protein